MPQHQGVDIASFQHPGGAAIDCTAAVADLTKRGGGAQPFVLVKITEGTGYVNPYWRADVAGFANAGAAVGGYIFDHGAADPGAEEQFARHIVGPGLPLLVDAETPEGLSPAQYRDHAAAVVGQEPVKVEYLNQSQVAAGVWSPGCWLWLADYSGDPSHGEKLRQITSSATVAGIQGLVDFNVWCGTEDEYAALFHTGPIPAPPAPTPPAVAGVVSVNGNNVNVPRLTQGDTGHWVNKMQGMLRAWYPTLNQDGDFGAVTARTVRAFQAGARIGVDGIVFTETWTRLLSD